MAELSSISQNQYYFEGIVRHHFIHEIQMILTTLLSLIEKAIAET